MFLHDDALWLQTLRDWKPREVLRDKGLNGQTCVAEACGLARVARPSLAA